MAGSLVIVLLFVIVGFQLFMRQRATLHVTRKLMLGSMFENGRTVYKAACIILKIISAERSNNSCKNNVTKEVLIPVNSLNTVKKVLSIL